MRHHASWTSLLTGFAAALVLGTGGTVLVAANALVISQKNQQFEPRQISLEQGQPLMIINDDAGTVHHAYVESDAFNFDSGDQKPGGKTTIMFPAKGHYQVLCGIHPKMKLDVNVE